MTTRLEYFIFALLVVMPMLVGDYWGCWFDVVVLGGCGVRKWGGDAKDG